MFRVLDVAENATRESVKDVEAMEAIAAGDQDVQVNQCCHVRPRDAQRRIETGHEIREFTEGDELGGVRIETRPFGVEPLEILLAESQLLLVVGLVEVLQEDGDVHVDDNHRGEDDEGDQVERGQHGTAAVAVRQIVIGHVAVGRLDEQRIEDVVPTGAGHQPEEEQHAAPERFKVDHLVESARMDDVTEQSHADDGVDEGDEGQQGANVKQGRKGDDQSKEKFADSLGRLSTDGERNDQQRNRLV